MSQLYHEFGVVLERTNANENWGIRLAGGSDLNSPLIVIRINSNSSAAQHLLKGDVITKIEDYDSRDLRHEDAQLLFRTQDNKIRLVVRRDNKVAMNSSKSNPISSLPPPNVMPSYIPPPNHSPYRVPSPISRGPHNMAVVYANPIENLPHTEFPKAYQYEPQMNHYDYQASSEQKQEQHVNYPPPPPPRNCFSPQLTRDFYQTSEEETASIQHQLVHKQFNSPIGLYSDNNIEHTIKNTISPLSPVASSMGSSSVPSPNGTLNRPHQHLPTKIEGYKKTVVFDPLKSETYRALQEGAYGNEKMHEVAAPAQTRVFMPNKLVPGKKPVSSFPPPDPISRFPVNAMGDASEVIHQSNSFYRLMHSVMGENDY